MRSDILTYSGNYFSFTDIQSNVIKIEDIAHGLSNTCRFAGQCPQFYSVAQHSVLVATLMRDRLDCGPLEQMYGLMHDASEAFMGDMTSPLKRLIPEYVRIEAEVQDFILRSVGLVERPSRFVKIADLMALAIEKIELVGCTDEWSALSGVEYKPFDLHPAGPGAAKGLFLKHFDYLTRKILG